MYKLIAIDLDGTLLTDDLKIAPQTIKVVQEAVESGAIVTIATGRMIASAKKFAKQLGIDVPIIAYQGAAIKDLRTKEILYERSLSPKVSREVIAFAKQNNVHLQVYKDDQLYGAVANDILLTYAEKTEVPYNIEPDLFKLAETGLTKAIFIDEPHVLKPLEEGLSSLLGETAHITKSTPRFLEVTHPEANKGHALRYLIESLGVDPAHTIGIGDNFNDKELLTTAGLGVAMGNAVDELKDLAGYVTFSNNDQGVKHVIEKFMLAEPINKP